MVDKTIAGEGEVVDLKYPDDWDTLVLKPGESVTVTGTLKGVTKTHTDRVKVTGTPLVECPVTVTDPFGGKNDETRPSNAVDVKDGGVQHRRLERLPPVPRPDRRRDRRHAARRDRGRRSWHGPAPGTPQGGRNRPARRTLRQVSEKIPSMIPFPSPRHGTGNGIPRA